MRDWILKTLAVGSMCLLPTLAFAGLTPAFYINSLYDLADTVHGMVVTPASPATVDNTSACSVSDGYAVLPTDANYNEKVAMLMAAYLGGRPVVIFLSHTSGDCAASRPRIVDVSIQ
jgi:hypothetical protein